MSTTFWCFGLVTLIGTSVWLLQEDCPVGMCGGTTYASHDDPVTAETGECCGRSCGTGGDSTMNSVACCSIGATAADSVDDAPLKCSLDSNALDQRIAESRLIFQRADSVVELDNGYRWKFAGADEGLIRTLAEWITFERTCCEFFEYQLTVHREGEVTFALTGGPGVKEFIRAQKGV